jgi:predicted flap endonuclease-1-like 5' DNA nuclease
LTSIDPNIQFIPLVVGIVFAGMIADRMGRKTGFSISVFLIGVLTIFGEAAFGSPIVLAVVERFVEGFLLGIGLMLIWSELGSPKNRGRRIAMVWFFFLGYMTLFWLVDFEGFGLGVPSDPNFRNLMGPSAILLTLLAQYWSAHIPSMLGREMEMEDLEISISDKEVKKTVDAYLGDEDFASIRSQVDIIDATEDVSDDELKEILGEEYDQLSSLRSIPGIGPNLEKKLIAAGYNTPAQLAGETKKRLSSKIEGLSEKRAGAILEETRKRVKKTIDKKKNQS